MTEDNRTRVTLKDQRDHLGGFDPESFVADPEWDKKAAAKSARNTEIAGCIMALVGMARVPWLRLFHVHAHTLAHRLPSFIHFHL